MQKIDSDSGRCEELERFLERLRSREEVSPDEIRNMVGRIHLNVSGLQGHRWFDPGGENARVLLQIFKELEKISKDGGVRSRDGGGLLFVASYPRSGNTMALQSLAKLGGVQTFTDEIATPRYMPFTFFPSQYPLTRIVKSHRVLEAVPSCRYVYIVRDGRDILPSIAYMSRVAGPGPGGRTTMGRRIADRISAALGKLRVSGNCHPYTRRRELADFMVWLKSNYRYGDWIDFHGRLDPLKGKENVLVVRYPDLVESVEGLRKIAEHLGVAYEEETLLAAYENRDDILERLAGSSANEKWGLGEEFDKDSLFYAWSKNRSGSNWRETMDSKAKKMFHELGGTRFLLEYGFESDPDWWR